MNPLVSVHADDPEISKFGQGEGKKAKRPEPVVFMFQPTEFKVAQPSQLADWEKLMQERVGIKGGRWAAGASYTATTCCCPCADDCDVD
jgi:hypothetical protein